MNKRRLYIGFFFLLASFTFSSKLFSQTIKASIDRNKIFIGEQIKLKIAVEGGKAGMRWFSFPDSINHFEIVKKSKIDTVLNGSYTNYYQTLAITSFDSGRWQFPAISLAGVSQSAPPITIDVLPVDVSKMQDYNDIKDIEDVKQETDWTIIGIISAATLLSIAVLIWLFMKKKKVPSKKPVLAGNISPLDWALAELNKLKEQSVNTPAEIKKYYSALTDISRSFFNKQFNQHSLQQTTDEWMVNLQPLAVDNDTKTSFFQFLRLADTVKFAKYQPPARENQTSVEVIKTMLQKVSLLHSSIYSKYQQRC